MKPSQVRGIIFDLGSTLIDFEGDYDVIFPQSIAALADHLSQEGLTVQRSVFIQAFHLALSDYHAGRDENHIEHTTFAILKGVLEALNEQHLEDDVLRDGLSAMYALSEAYWQPKPSMIPVLDQLHSTGYHLGLLSNAGDEANVQRLIDKVGIRSFFNPILISAALGIRKPDPRPIQMILELWALPACEVVMVGDLLEADILGAQRAGIHQIWLRKDLDFESSSQLKEIQPEAIALDLAEIPGLIRSWNQKG